MNIVKEKWNRIGLEAAWLVAGQGLTALGGLAAIRILTGHYTREVYGISWLFINGAGLAVLLLADPMGQALNRFYHEDGGQEQIDRLLALIWRLEIFLALCVGAVYLIAASLMGKLAGTESVAYFVMPVYFLFLSAMNAAQALLNTSRRRVRRVVLLAAEAWLKPAGALILCLLWKPNVNSFVLGYASASIITGSVGIFWIKGFSGKPLLRMPMPDGDYIRRVLSYSLPWIGFSSCSWVLSISGRYFVGWYLGAALTGTYVASYQVGAALFQFLGGSFGPLVQPIIFQRAGKNGGSCGGAITAAFRAFAWISLPVLSAFIVMHGWLVRWLAAPAYWGGAKVTVWIGLGVYFWVLGDRARDSFLIARKTGAMMKINALAALLNVILNIILVPREGITGAGMALCLSYLVYMILMIRFGLRASEWKFPAGSFLAAGAVSAVAAIFAEIVHSAVIDGKFGIPSAPLVAMSFILALAISAWLCRPLLKKDIGTMNRI